MRRINYIVWSSLLLFLVSIFGYLLISGDIILFLAPRMIPMLCFGTIVLLILFINQLISIKDIEKKYNATFNIKYLLVAVPIVFFITAMPDETMINGMSNQNISIPYLSGAIDNLGEGGKKAYGTRKPPSEADDNVVQETNNDNEITADNGIPDITPCIYIDDKNRGELQDQFANLFSSDVMEMVGDDVSLYGFVLKYDVLGDNAIIIARKVVSCCIADAYIVGYPVRVESASDYEADEWIEVSGTISQTETSPENGSYPYPIIVGGSINKRDIPELDELYVYP